MDLAVKITTQTGRRGGKSFFLRRFCGWRNRRIRVHPPRRGGGGKNALCHRTVELRYLRQNRRQITHQLSNLKAKFSSGS
jgi:hypothetical protein